MLGNQDVLLHFGVTSILLDSPFECALRCEECIRENCTPAEMTKVVGLEKGIFLGLTASRHMVSCMEPAQPQPLEEDTAVGEEEVVSE